MRFVISLILSPREPGKRMRDAIADKKKSPGGTVQQTCDQIYRLSGHGQLLEEIDESISSRSTFCSVRGDQFNTADCRLRKVMSHFASCVVKTGNEQSGLTSLPLIPGQLLLQVCRAMGPSETHRTRNKSTISVSRAEAANDLPHQGSVTGFTLGSNLPHSPTSY
jgi:hypothetical protein